MKTPEELIQELKVMLVQALGLPIQPGDIDSDAPMFGPELGIDSVDALELMVIIEKNYGVKIENRTSGVEAFRSVRALSEYIRAHSPGAGPS